MNRIQHWPDLDDVTQHVPFQLECARLESVEIRDLAHSIFFPLHYEPNYAYPLLVWLHGPGDNETQLKRIMPLVSMRNYVGVAPRGTWTEEEDDVSQRRCGWRQHEEDISLAEQRVFDCIELAEGKFHIAPSQVFLAGYDCGGTMAFQLAMKHPGQFAGVLSVGGPFPSDHRPLLQIDHARRMSLLIAHGRDSRKYPIERVCQDLRLFHSAGLKVTLRQYPCGDEITTKMLSDLDAWIMEQVTGVPLSPTGETCYRNGELN